MTDTQVGEPQPEPKICAVCEVELAQGAKCPEHNQFGVPSREFRAALENLSASRNRKRLPDPTTHVLKQDPQNF